MKGNVALKNVLRIWKNKLKYSARLNKAAL